jgi:tripartite-type tricarboxylate transporter receptor subunit TctC
MPGHREERVRAPNILAWVALAAIALSTPGMAEGYPDRSVRMIVAFPAGGTLDVLARIVSQKLTEQWGQSVVVENRPGAGGNIGVTAVATAAPDGYTLHFGAQSIAVNAMLAPIKGFDPTRDLVPVVLVGTAQDVLMVPPDSPAHSVGDLVALAKAKPGTLDYASLGSGSSGHLATVLFADLTGIKLQHVPYSGINQAYTDIFTGRLSLWISTLGSHLANLQAGKVRALAVSGAMRAEQLPDVPTFSELGLPFVDETSWYAIFVPRDTPKEIVAKINADVNRILLLPDVREKQRMFGYRFIGGPPQRLADHLRSEIKRWVDVAKSAALAQ